MPDFRRTEPTVCSHRHAPWVPLCEHAGQARAGDLTAADIGRVVTTRDATGLLEAVHPQDDVAMQLLLVRGTGPEDVTVALVPAGEVVRVGWPRPAQATG